jgi:hypothetical protein
MFGSLAFISAVFASLALEVPPGAAGEQLSAAAVWWRPGRQLLASALVVLWALRLGGFLCYRSFKWVAQRPSRLLRCKLNRSKEAAE